VHFSEGLWHRFQEALLVLFTSYCCTFYADNIVAVKLGIFLRAQLEKSLLDWFSSCGFFQGHCLEISCVQCGECVVHLFFHCCNFQIA
jgi:hypothetical protein